MCASYKERLFFAILLGQSHLELLLVHVVVGVVHRTPDLVKVLEVVQTADSHLQAHFVAQVQAFWWASTLSTS